jgi:hypothetical protein
MVGQRLLGQLGAGLQAVLDDGVRQRLDDYGWWWRDSRRRFSMGSR